MENPCAFVVGYTGETGKAVVLELSRDDYFKKVVLVGRREVELPVQNDSRFIQKVVDFDDISKHEDVFRGCDVGFCCLGTTAGKSGKAGFVKVDHDYVVNTADVAKSVGCRHFLLQSSQGANKNSMLLYTKTKGQTEEDLKGLGFQRLSIFRPGFLLCDREEPRSGEKMAKCCLKPLTSCFPTLMSIPVETVAKAMIKNAKNTSSDPVETFENKTIHTMGK